jgi:hypothetical protein
MTISLKHSTTVAVPDNPAYPVGSSEYNAEHVLTLAADRVIGRLGSAGAAQELSGTDLATLIGTGTGGPVTASAFILSAAGVNVQTGTAYTLVAGDNGKVITLNNASPITLTFPIGLGAAFGCMIIQLGVGQVNVTASGGATVNGLSGLTHLAGRYAMATLFAVSVNAAVLGGELA